MQCVLSGMCLLECFPINTLQRHRLSSLEGATPTGKFNVTLHVCVSVHLNVCVCV